jgi:hypothetical protein
MTMPKHLDVSLRPAGLSVEDTNRQLEKLPRTARTRTSTRCLRGPRGGQEGYYQVHPRIRALTVDMAEQGELNADVAAWQVADALLVPLSQKGAANGVATLDGGQRITTSQLHLGH